MTYFGEDWFITDDSHSIKMPPSRYYVTTDNPKLSIDDHTLALRSLTTIIEWMLVRDKKRLGDKDVTEKLKEIDLVKALLGEEDE